MTTYTKTQLIDMAIDKLGESPDWDDEGFTLIAVSTQSNIYYGYGEFCLSDPEYINDCWKLVCTREEFEQRVTERKASKHTNDWWDYENDHMLCNPPVGTHCEFTWGKMDVWFKAIILPDNNIAYFYYDKWVAEPISFFGKCEYRPLYYKPKLTERQQAGLKLWRAINFNDTESDEFIVSQKRFEDYCKPYDQGLLK